MIEYCGEGIKKLDICRVFVAGIRLELMTSGL